MTENMNFLVFWIFFFEFFEFYEFFDESLGFWMHFGVCPTQKSKKNGAGNSSPGNVAST